MEATRDPVSGDELRRLQQDGEWFQANYEALRSDFPGRFVAVHGQEVVAHGETREDLHEAVRESTDLDPTRTLVEYVPEPGRSLKMIRNVPKG